MRPLRALARRVSALPRTLRGAWARRAVLLPLVLLTVVVVGGVVAVLGYADAAGTSRLLAVPLVVLGAVALPATGRELAASRRGEIALARLRGLSGGELFASLAAEPLLALGLGALGGLALGGVTATLATRHWTAVEATGLGWTGVLVAVLVVLVALVGVLAGAASAVREPLADQVRGSARPRPAGVTGLFGQVLVVVAALVACYRAAGAAQRPDALVLAGPALVGLTVGLLVTLALGALARVGSRRGGPLPLALATRRLGRLGETAPALRVLVAAAVVSAVAATGATQVGAWTDRTARLRLGGPVQWQVDLDAPGALALTRAADPDGRWLMASVLVPGEGAATERRAFVDAARFERVVGDFLADTPAAGAAALVPGLAADPAPVASGAELVVTVAGVSGRTRGRLTADVALDLRSPDGRSATTHVSADIPLDGGTVTTAVAAPQCDQGCTLAAITLGPTPGTDAPTSPPGDDTVPVALPWVLTGVALGGSDLLDPGAWHPARRGSDAHPGGPVPVTDGLLAVVARKPLTALPGAPDAPEPGALVTTTAGDDADAGAGDPLPIADPGGGSLPTRVTAALPALPLVEADGVLADLPTALAQAPPTVPAARVAVLARADAPESVLDAVRRAGGRPVDLPRETRLVSDAARAGQARVYQLMAAFSLAVAVLVLVTALARQRRGWLHDVAALRVVGVRLRTLRAAAALEVLTLAVVAATATAAGTWLGVRLLLRNLTLVEVPVHALPLVARLSTGPLLALTAIAGGSVLLVGALGRRPRPRASRPASLREAALR